MRTLSHIEWKEFAQSHMARNGSAEILLGSLALESPCETTVSDKQNMQIITNP